MISNISKFYWYPPIFYNRFFEISKLYPFLSIFFVYYKFEYSRSLVLQRTCVEQFVIQTRNSNEVWLCSRIVECRLKIVKIQTHSKSVGIFLNVVYKRYTDRSLKKIYAFKIIVHQDLEKSSDFSFFLLLIIIINLVIFYCFNSWKRHVHAI